MIKFILTFLLLFPVAIVGAQVVSTLPDVEQEALPAQDELPAPALEFSIEANSVTIVLNDEHRQGVDWEAIVSDFHTVPLKKQDDPAWSDKKSRLSIGVVSSEDYAVLLEALDTVGKMTQKPHPAVSVKMDEEVNEALSENVHINLGISRLSSNDIRLNLEPRLILPKSTMTAKTDLALKDNATVVIGGIFHEEEISRTRKFPLLGDLPLVGLVFRSRGRLMQKSETVIFLTVRVNNEIQ